MGILGYVRPGNMCIAGERVQNENSIIAVFIELSPGFKRQSDLGNDL
ncbi:Uncharacterised protein [Mycobacteroides abscessus subsp. abscessus]|nr:Uncharacterised protein [Mycobacteroides abscessus subsp. abscessus]